MNLIDILFIPINKIKKTIGKTDDTGGSSSDGTVMGKLNNIISNNVSSTIGTTTDTGATATAGTVMGKLNNLVGFNKRQSFKALSASVPINSTDYTILSANGVGEFYGVYSSSVTNVKIIVDGIEYSIAGYASGTRSYRGSTSGGIGIFYGNTDIANMINSIPFKTSIVVKVSTGSSTANPAITYTLYE